MGSPPEAARAKADELMDAVKNLTKDARLRALLVKHLHETDGGDALVRLAREAEEKVPEPRKLLDKCEGKIHSFALFRAVKSFNLLETSWTEADVQSFSETCASVNFRLLTDRDKKKKGYLLEFDSSEVAKNAMTQYKGKYALTWNYNGYGEQIEVLAKMADPEDWSSKGEDGVVRPLGVLKNYVEMSFKNIAAHQPDKLMFSEDGSWAAFDTRLLTPIERGLGLQKIYAVFQKTDGKGRCRFQKTDGKGEVPYWFKGWYTWGTGPTKYFGGDPPKPLSTENPNPNIEVPEGWQSFNPKYTFQLNDAHILVDNFERLRKSCTPSSETQLQERRCYLFLGNPEQGDVDGFFAAEGFVKPKTLHFRGENLALRPLVYAEFESAVAAAAMEKKCRDEKKKIGGTSCKPVLSQGPPSEDEVKEILNKLRRALGHAKIMAHNSPQCVLPQLFLPGNDINNGFVPQLLMPLHLNTRRAADAALAVEIKKDKSECGWFYRASTMLTLEMTLNNARYVRPFFTPWPRGSA